MKIAVYCGSTKGKDEAFLTCAKQLGKEIGSRNHTLVYGGAMTGLMGAVADATLDASGKVIGVLPNVEEIQGRRHPGLTTIIETETMSERKEKMIEEADGFIALPGGPGTLDEVAEVLSLQRLNIVKKPCVLYDVNGYYDGLRMQWIKMIEMGFVKETDFSRFLISDDLEEIMDFLEEMQ